MRRCVPSPASVSLFSSSVSEAESSTSSGVSSSLRRLLRPRLNKPFSSLGVSVFEAGVLGGTTAC
jgi:hypothetical protein